MASLTVLMNGDKNAQLTYVCNAHAQLLLQPIGLVPHLTETNRHKTTSRLVPWATESKIKSPLPPRKAMQGR